MKIFSFAFGIINLLMLLIFLSATLLCRLCVDFAFWFVVISFLVWIVLNVALIVLFSILKRNALNLLFFALPLSLWAMMYVLSFFAVPDRLAFFFSLPRIEKDFSSMKSTMSATDSADDSGKFQYAAIMWLEEFLDDYSVIVFDESDNFLELYKAKDEALLKSFGYDIRRVTKLKKHYYRVQIES